jgi:hypothetical protein
MVVATPPRAPDDWSMVARLDCSCELCRRLARFLTDAKSIEHRWPLATEQRRHVHTIIDRHELAVTHETLRSGRPYTLVLRKQKRLFTDEKERAKEHARLLQRLQRSDKGPARRTP